MGISVIDKRCQATASSVLQFIDLIVHSSIWKLVTMSTCVKSIFILKEILVKKQNHSV